MSTRRRNSLVTGVALGLFVAACGSAGGESTKPATSTTTAATTAGVTAASTASNPTAAAAASLKLKKIGSFDSPVYVTAPPGDTHRVFVVEQTGKIRVVLNGKTLKTPFADLKSKIVCCGEQGLLSIAFAPDYAKSGRLYAGLTFANGDDGVVELRRASANRAKSTVRTVIRFHDPESNHNGGLVKFGPDKLLYYGVGDGGGAGDQHGAHGNGQNMGVLLGKLLRINPVKSGSRAYTVPKDNPFVGRAGARPEIWSYGLRNPWRFSFDRSNGALVIGDVGQGAVEEIDYASEKAGAGKGVNYGWRVFEGNTRYNDSESAPGAVSPVFTYTHANGCSITGGYVVRDAALKGFVGRYVYADYCAGDIHSVLLRDGGASGDRKTGLHVDQLTSFGEDARGRIYAASQTGPVYRLTAG